MKNIYSNVRVPMAGELFKRLLKYRNVVIEEIVSSSKIIDKLYVQKQDEWVLLLKGSAKLEVKGRVVSLKKGDHIFIKSGVPHKVLKVRRGTIWLAIHIHKR